MKDVNSMSREELLQFLAPPTQQPTAAAPPPMGTMSGGQGMEAQAQTQTMGPRNSAPLGASQASVDAAHSLDERQSSFAGKVADVGAQFLPDAASMATGLPAAAGVTALTGNPALGAGAGVLVSAFSALPAVRIRAWLQGREPDEGEFATETAIQGGSTLFGYGAEKALSKIASTAVGKAVPGVLEADSFMRSWARDLNANLVAKGVDKKIADQLTAHFFTPAEITKGRLLDYVENFGSGSVTAQRFQEFKEARDILINEVADAVVGKAGQFMKPEETADLLAATINGIRSAKRAEIGALHEEVAQLVSGQLVDTRGIKTALAREKANLEALKGASPDPQGIQALIDKVERLPDQVPFDAIKDFRTDLDDKVYEVATANTKARFKRAGGKVRAETTAAMERALTAYDSAHPGVSSLKMWKMANEETRAFYETADSIFVQRLVRDIEDKGEGKVALQGLLRGSSPRRISHIRDLVGEQSNTWKTVQSWANAEILESAETDGVVNGKRLMEIISAQRKLGESATKAIIGERGYGTLHQFASALELAQRRPKVGGSMLVQFTEAGAFLKLAEGDWRGGAVLLTTAGLARIASSPVLTRLLIDGLKHPMIHKGMVRKGGEVGAKILANLGQGDFVEIPPTVRPEVYAQWMREKRSGRQAMTQ